MTGRVIHRDERGAISELAFARRAVITPHSNPNHTLFIVISGGGYVQVGDERARVNHGEAVVWPAGELHGAYTDGTEMRAIVVELPEGGVPLVLEGTATRSIVTAAGDAATAAAPGGGAGPTRATDDPGSGTFGPAGAAPTRAEGRLAERDRPREDHDETEGEPW